MSVKSIRFKEYSNKYMDGNMDYQQNYLFKLFILLFCMIIPYAYSFGYDSANSCSPKSSRHGRAQILETIPCDLNQQSYCNLPGSSYPWHAVRRFVHENQGLMKRMYGDVRHISILRSEIQNNDIDVEDIEFAAARYSRNGFRKTKFLHSEYQNLRNNDVLTEPHFRPTTTTGKTTTTTTTPTTSTTTRTPSTTETTTTVHPKKESINTKPELSETYLNDSPDNNLESNHIYDTTTNSVQSHSPDTIKIVQAPNLTQNKTESATISTTLRVVQQIIKSEIESENTSFKQQVPDAEIIQKPSERIDFNIESNIDDTKGTILVENTESKQNLPLNEENKVKENLANDKKKIPARPNTMEGQLFQDAVPKETPVLNSRGVNACPVKEEVVAPFWANNTRGEVLALLNLYPFEQYVHWEKCTQEHKQMYCREGCRCEQQYRLHRLLAYDPHNECRGIFSDWFRFPSCCICKCYDIPLEFRVTSRSPRTSGILDDGEDKIATKHPIDLAEDVVQKAIYAHATEDWYRPRDEFDLYD